MNVRVCVRACVRVCLCVLCVNVYEHARTCMSASVCVSQNPDQLLHHTCLNYCRMDKQKAPNCITLNMDALHQRLVQTHE